MMRKLVLKMSMSLDGFVGGPNGEIEWLLRSSDDVTAAWILAVLWDADTHIMGSKTFYDMASYWPYAKESFALPMNKIPKVVFSKKRIDLKFKEENTTQALKDSIRLQDHSHSKNNSVLLHSLDSWENAIVANGDLVDEITRLKQQPGKPILAHGGASFNQSLIATGLVDEYKLLIHPVVLGKGLPLFSALGQSQDLILSSTTILSSGCIGVVYRPTI